MVTAKYRFPKCWVKHKCACAASPHRGVCIGGGAAVAAHIRTYSISKACNKQVHPHTGEHMAWFYITQEATRWYYAAPCAFCKA